MRRWFSWHGAAAGLAAGAALVWALVAGWLTGGMPIVAGALAERARGLLPLQVLGYIIVRFKFAAKPLGFWFTMGTVVLVCAVAGGFWAARRQRPLAAALVAALVVGAALAGIAGPPSIAYLSARLGAEGVEGADAQALATIVLAIAGYTALAAAVFAIALGLLTRGRSSAGPVGTPRNERAAVATGPGLHGRGR